VTVAVQLERISEAGLILDVFSWINPEDGHLHIFVEVEYPVMEGYAEVRRLALQRLINGPPFSGVRAPTVLGQLLDRTPVGNPS